MPDIPGVKRRKKKAASEGDDAKENAGDETSQQVEQSDEADAASDAKVSASSADAERSAPSPSSDEARGDVAAKGASSEDGQETTEASPKRQVRENPAAGTAAHVKTGGVEVRKLGPEKPKRPAPPPKKEEPPSTEDFAALLDDHLESTPEFGAGDLVSATIVAIGDSDIFVSLGGKSDGVVSRAEFLDEDDNLTVDVGDEIEAYVVSSGAETVQLSVALGRQMRSTEMLERAAAEGIPVEGKVVDTAKRKEGDDVIGFEVNLMGRTAFCPISQIEVDFTEDPERHLGETYRFRILRVEEGGRNVVVSRADLQREERERAAEETLASLEAGEVRTGTVKKLMDFGAFVDIGGIEGLLHVSEMGWMRVEHPGEVVREGEQVRVKVQSIDDSDPTRSPRISLSMKELMEDPYQELLGKITVGDKIEGTVSRLESFGAFIELAPGVDGLAHISQLGTGRRINHPREVLDTGQTVEAQVISVDPIKRQIGLSLAGSADDPWQRVASSAPVGSKVQGTVAAIERFGIFVDLPAGVRALIPMSHLGEGEERSIRSTFEPGTEIEATVIEVDPKRRRMTLSRKASEEAAERAAYRNYVSGQEESGGLGTLGDLLKKQLGGGDE